MQCVPILGLHFSGTTGPVLLKPNINIEKGGKKKKETSKTTSGE